MQIFYINTDEYKVDKKVLEKFKTRRFLSKTKEHQHLMGRYLLEKIAKEVFKIEKTEIEIVNKKPKFKNSDLQFSISHSKNIVLIAFDKNLIGADVEEMKERDFKEIFERYNYKGQDISKETFYKFWTEYEAEIKLQAKPKIKISTVLEDNFMLTVAGDFNEKYEIVKM